MTAEGLGVVVRQPLLAADLLETQAASELSPFQHAQTRKFFHKKAVSSADANTFRERVGLAGHRLLRALHYDRTPDNLSYPDDQGVNKLARQAKAKTHFFATKLSADRRKPLARTLRHMHRASVAVGGRHDEGAARIGYFRMSFHPDDDGHHGTSASDRSRMAADHIVKHYPEMPLEHFKDELGDGRHVHHIEIPHYSIPNAIRHLKEWQEILNLTSWISG
jgi:hypothetical protein